MKLTPILANIQKYYPELNLSQFQNYCAQADAPETEKTNQFHFGYNSLKWALESINTINPDAVKNTMLFIIFEQNARNLPFKTIQHNINSYTAILPFKSQIQQRETINISTLQTIKAGPFFFCINNTTKNLTAQIFRKTTADAILFVNPDTKAAGIIFRVNSTANLLEGFKQYLVKTLTSIEPGWETIGPDINLIINHGATNSTPSTININQLQSIVQNYPGFKS